MMGHKSGEKIFLFLCALAVSITVISSFLIFLYFLHNRFESTYPGQETYLYLAKQRLAGVSAKPEGALFFRAKVDFREALQSLPPRRVTRRIFIRIEPESLGSRSFSNQLKEILVRDASLIEGSSQIYFSVPWAYLRGIDPKNDLSFSFYLEAKHLKTTEKNIYSEKIRIPHPSRASGSNDNNLGEFRLKKIFPYSPPALE